jgi:hypothetical protein
MSRESAVMSEPPELDHEARQQRWSFISWPLLLAVAFIIFEVTNEPSFAALAMCLKFGWEDFRTAWWLKRTDPERGRGRACAWLYLAAGLWQTAIIGVAMVFLTVVLVGALQGNLQGAQGLLSLILGALAAIVFGFVLSTLATFIALAYARKHGVRPWLNGAVHFARRRREWPPLYGHRNRVLMLVVSAVVVACCLLLPVTLWIIAEAVRPAVPARVLREVLALGSLVCVIFLLPAALLFVIDMRRRGFFAKHPADCWGEEPLPMTEGDAEREEIV